MKKAFFFLTIGFTLTYCNPSQESEQTVADSSRMNSPMSSGTDTTNMNSMPDTMNTNMGDTMNRSMPDTMRRNSTRQF